MAKIIVLLISLLLAVFTKAQPGFISIDCGSPDGTNYTDQETGIFYTSDYGYIQTGVSKNISLHHNSTYVSRQYWSIRSFPNGSRNCYTLKSLEKGNKYILRASFMYDDDDDNDHVEIRAPPPQFDLYLGATLWTAVAAVNATRWPWWSEIATVAMADFLLVCLVRKEGFGDPFISSLELRPLDDEMYPVMGRGQALVLIKRINFGSALLVRYKDDPFDRIWEGHDTNTNHWITMNTTKPVTNILNISKPPSTVLQTAISPANNGSTISFKWTADDPETIYYSVWHFAELEVLDAITQVREFSVCIEDIICYQRLHPYYLKASLIHYMSMGRLEYNGVLVRTQNSTLPPLLNAVEVYKLLPLMIKQGSTQ